MYWNKVLGEVLSKQCSRNFIFTNFKEKQLKTVVTKTSKGKMYYLGEKFPGLYLTQREADCMLQMLRGKSVDGIAKAIALSPRTVEFYIKNIKKKLSCRTKFDLVDKIIDSDFMNYFSNKIHAS